MTRTPVAVPVESYYRRRYPTAFALLDWWEYWYSHRRLRWAAEACWTTQRRLPGAAKIIEWEI